MDKIYEAINTYLNTSNPPPNLVLLLETPGLGASLLKMGFNQQDEYYIISKSDAQALLVAHQPHSFDWNTHWAKEKQRPLGKL